MATTLQVHVVTPEKKIFSGSASEVTIPAWEGELVVLPDHDQLLALLRAGTCTVVTQNGPQTWVIGRGFAEIGPDVVNILTSVAVVPTEIDREKAKSDLELAERALADAEFGTASHAIAQTRIEQAQAFVNA